MRVIAYILFSLTLIGCAKSHSPESSTQADLSATCSQPTSVTHAFINGPSQAAQDYACPDLYPKMNCHYFVGALGDRELACTDIDINSQQGVPSGFKSYHDGMRLFLDGTLGFASAYDGGIMYGGLRCFYFVGANGTINEDILCQD